MEGDRGEEKEMKDNKTDNNTATIEPRLGKQYSLASVKSTNVINVKTSSNLKLTTRVIQTVPTEEEPMSIARHANICPRLETTARDTTTVPMKLCESSVESVSNNLNPKTTPGAISSPFTQYEGLKHEVLSHSNPEALKYNSYKENHLTMEKETSASIVRNYSRSRPTTRVITTVPMKLGENSLASVKSTNVINVKTSSNLKLTTRVIQTVPTEEEPMSIARHANICPRLETTARDTTTVPMKLCESSVESVSNNLNPKTTPGAISSPFTQYEGLKHEVLSHSNPEALKYNSYKENHLTMEKETSASIVRNYSRSRPTTRVITTFPMKLGENSAESVTNNSNPKQTSRDISSINNHSTVKDVRKYSRLKPTTSVILTSPMQQSFYTDNKRAPEDQYTALKCVSSTCPSTEHIYHSRYKASPDDPYALLQCDGGDTESETSEDSQYTDSEDEVDSAPIRATLVPSAQQGPIGAPLQLEVDISGQVQSPRCVPLCVVTNPRSAWNKINNIRTFLRQVGPDFMILSEHWGRKKPLENALKSQHYKICESSRGIRGIPTRGRNGNQAVSVTGGGVAIVYCEQNFHVEDAHVDSPEGIEAVWLILTPKEAEAETVKKILVGGIYIAPRSLFKQATIDHIIETMFCVQSRYGCQVRFLISGDFNKVSIEDILESNGALHQVCSVATRNQTTLELVITDMATMFHPPTTLPPLNQDENSSGKPADHNVIIVAPRTDLTYKVERHKKKVHVRPQPQSKKDLFMRDMGSKVWPNVFLCEDANDKASNFHTDIIHTLESHLQMKTVNMTSLDKPWFSPALKLMYNEKQNEFFKNGKSPQYLKLRNSYKKARRRAAKTFYPNFVKDLKETKPGQYYKMAKRIGAVQGQNSGDIRIECLDGLNASEQVEEVARAFSEISCQYDPVNLNLLPAYLPAEKPPQLNVYKVYRKIHGQKKTKSTLPIDLPQNLRKEAATFLAEPLTDIYNACLTQGVFPRIWKKEYVTPVPKVKPNEPIKEITDVRKIASTSDYSKIFESFLLEYILEDISEKLSKTQYGGKRGVGTEHLMVKMIDRIKKLQDNPEQIAVVLKSYDWSGAFDRLDPTNVTTKCIKLGIRSSIIKILIDFLNERKMQVKMNQHTSSSYDLIGGGPQGSLIGQLLYIIGSDDVAEEVPEDDKYKYIDDLAVLDAVKNPGDKLEEYNVHQHVPSDVATEERFLPSTTFKSQTINNSIADWTMKNKMKINENKTKYMIFNKSQEKFATRLSMNNKTINRTHEMKHLGVWLSDTLKWDKHISELCKKAYPRLRILTKLKYVGVPIQDLIELYCTFVRSLTEYCSTAFHSSLSLHLSNKIEAIQRTSLKMILGVMYVDENSALEMCGLMKLHERREHRALDFGLKCIKHATNQFMFPQNPSQDKHNVRNREKFKVNKVRSESYKKSTIPYLQMRLNSYFSKASELRRRAARNKGVGGRSRRTQ